LGKERLDDFFDEQWLGRSGGYATEQTTYFSDAAYEPDGQPAWFLYGNGLCRSFGYNSRMQLASSADSVVQGTAPQGTTCFNAGQQPLALAYNWTDSHGKNDGNLWGMTTYQNGPSFPQALSFNATFLYDNANRLTWAED
jgi:hypothetical protein